MNATAAPETTPAAIYLPLFREDDVEVAETGVITWLKSTSTASLARKFNPVSSATCASTTPPSGWASAVS